MPVQFSKCEQCGRIFPDDEGQQLCSKCRQVTEDSVTSVHEQLRLCKNALRDVQSNGSFLTVPELSQKTGVEENQIWHFIQTGEIETASFSDPDVRSFVVKRQKEKLKASATKAKETTSADREEQKRSGFHLRVEDERDK